ncbi:MAG TPA: fused MFS/spermidine synthase, partial [Thermoanaerobaculia bacterium]
VAAVVVFPAAAVAGFQFPLLIGLLGEGRNEVGRDAGLAYAWNTAGAIAGSLAGGFGSLPRLTAPGAWTAVAILLAALASAAIVLSWLDEGAGASLAVPAVIGAAALACFAAQGPTAVWRHTPIGAGRAETQTSDRAWRAWMHEQRRSILWELDGIESSVALTRGAGMAFLVNGKSDGHFRSDAGTQVMVGMIGAALHPHPRRAFVIGLGSGSTAGWIARMPTIESVDVAELEPGIVRVARHAAPVNGGALASPRLHVHFGDARELLLTSKEGYDLIVSEPSNPYRAGVASLFTREFYEAVRQRLNPGGIFVQWVQTYEIETGTIRSVYGTLSSVFASVESWQSQPTDLVLVASDRGRRLDGARLRRLVESPPLRDAMHGAWRTETLEGFLARFVATDAFARALVAKTAPRVNSDDRNFLEFEAARSVGGEESFDIGALRSAASESGQHRPPLRGEVDWNRVDIERLGVHSSNEDEPPSPVDGPPELAARARAHAEWTKGRLGAALAEWRGCCREVVSSLEIAMVAELEAEAQEATADAWLDALALEQPVEADLIRARLRWRQNRLDEAAALLERGYVAYRSDPWPMMDVVSRSLSIAEFTAAERPDLAPRIHRALERPFAVYSVDEQRRRTLLSIAQRMERSCGEKTLAGIRGFEPWVPWERHFLTVRADCYDAVRDPRAARARKELNEFLADEPESLLR